MPRRKTNYNAVSQETKREDEPIVLMKVREVDNPVRVRSGPGTNFPQIAGRYLGKGMHDIVEVVPGEGSSLGWGKLSEVDGWVALDYVDFVE